MKKTRQEMAYEDAVVEMLHDYITNHCTECAENALEFCLKNASLEERIAYSQKYGCICGTCCKRCKNAKDCGIED